jgi:hypothetical protein
LSSFFSFLFIILSLDPLPPVIENVSSFSFSAKWDPVRFCGISYSDMVNSLTYSLEVAEGVDWKETALSKYINDNIASSYKTVFRGKNIINTIIENLKPAKWYHARLIIDYLGLRVMSESISFHTLRSCPSIPTQPRVNVVPVQNSFDSSSLIPARLDLLVSWNPSLPNGFPVERYQVHLKRFDLHGKILYDEPPLLNKKPHTVSCNPQKSIGLLVKGSRSSNQWIASPGKSEIQIRNSVSRASTIRSRSPSPPPAMSPPNTSGSLGFFDSQTIFQGSKRPASWKIIYDNLNRNVKLFSPKFSDGEWWLRVRAKNAEGWSAFSSTYVINHFNYPSLFPHPIVKEKEEEERRSTANEYAQYFYPKPGMGSNNNSSLPHPGAKSLSETYQKTTDAYISRSADENDRHVPHYSNNSGVQFKNHRFDQSDRFHDHQQEVGLFWDHKAVNNSTDAYLDHMSHSFSRSQDHNDTNEPGVTVVNPK